MASQVLPSISDLRQCLSYDPETGILTWIARPRGASPVVIGTEAFKSVHKSLQYKCGGIYGWKGLAHKVIWAIVYGYWPTMAIDHINGIKTDNRLINLRLATPKQNRANQGKYQGKYMKGVAYCGKCRNKPWRAVITSDGNHTHLGYFRCETSAHIAYLLAAVSIHGQYAKLTSSRQTPQDV